MAGLAARQLAEEQVEDAALPPIYDAAGFRVRFVTPIPAIEIRFKGPRAAAEVGAHVEEVTFVPKKANEDFVGTGARLRTTLAGTTAAQSQTTRIQGDHPNVVKGRVLARHGGLRDALGNFDVRRQTFIFGVEPKETKVQSLSPIKVVCEYLYRNQVLPDSFFDHSVRYQLRIVWDHTCDETVDSLSHEGAVDESGKPLGRDYVLRPLEGVPKGLLEPELLLPCYVLRSGNYKALKQNKPSGALKPGDRSESVPLSDGSPRLRFPVVTKRKHLIQGIARRKPSGEVNYFFADHLGSSRIVTDATGTILDESDYYPFGGERIVVNDDPNPYKFTGKERDSESGLDNFGARYFGSSLGRFTSPDPKIPHLKHLLNPQKWNKYPYTLNNPLRYVDPDGLDEIEVQPWSFIPQRSVSVTVLGIRFAGDNRTFSTARNASSRTSITVRIETDASERPGNPIISITQPGTAGQTKQLDSNGNVVRTATATEGLPTVTGARDANGNVVLNFQQDTKNPLLPQALTPGISIDLMVTVPQNASSVTAAGTTSGFPAIELNVTPEGQPTMNIPLTDPGPNASAFKLFIPNPLLVSKPLPPPPPPCATDKDKPCTNK